MIGNIIERSRFAFDMGTSSIGWAVYRLDDHKPPRPCELVDCGVRLFSDGRNPKDGQSLAAMRRTPRAARRRRRRDRFLQRRTWLITLLVRHGLMPADEDERKALRNLDVYAIRGRALDERLEPFEIGRALFHLNQRRGYKSNRIADAKAADEKDKGKIASAGERLDDLLNGRTRGASITPPSRPDRCASARACGPASTARGPRPSMTSIPSATCWKMSSTAFGPSRRPITPP